MGFSLEALVDKVGQKMDKKSHSTNLNYQGNYDRMSNSHVPSGPPPAYSEHSQDLNDSEAYTGVGLLGMGREPRGVNARRNYTRRPERLDKERHVLQEYADPGRQRFSPPPAAAEPAFTGGGLLGKMMNAESGGKAPFGRESLRPGPRLAPPRRGRMRSASEGHQGPPGRYRHENGPPRHEDLQHREGLHPNHARDHYAEGSHRRSHESGRRGSREHGRDRGFEHGEKKMQDPFDDRERY